MFYQPLLQPGVSVALRAMVAQHVVRNLPQQGGRISPVPGRCIHVLGVAQEHLVRAVMRLLGGERTVAEIDTQSPEPAIVGHLPVPMQPIGGA